MIKQTESTNDKPEHVGAIPKVSATSINISDVISLIGLKVLEKVREVRLLTMKEKHFTHKFLQ